MKDIRTAHYLQHIPFETLGSIESWLRATGSAVTCTRFFESTSLPDPRLVDLLIVMGGPMSVNDEMEFPWLLTEKRFIRECIEAGKRVLGVCLGAQLIASALGARVYPNRFKEIGWFPVKGLAPAGGAFSFPPSLEVFHWHGETFDLPAGAVHIARSEGCENQAFQIERSVVGLQFHLETTPESLRAMVSHFKSELVPAGYVQSEAQILQAPPEKYRAINSLMAAVLSYLLE
jgi:GMP synthase-like glutamine amidotransferase